MTIKELVENKDIPDDRQIDVPISDGKNQTVTMKEWRDYVRGVQGDVQAREETIAALVAAASQPAQPQNQPQTQPANVPRETRPSDFDYARDPLFGPMDSRIAALEKLQQQVVQYLGQQNTQTANQIAAQYDSIYRQGFDMAKDKYPGVTYDQALKYARDNNITNPRNGILDPLRAAHELSADSRMETVKKAEYARGLADKQKELEEAQRAQGIAAIALPGMAASTGSNAFKPKPQLGLQGNIKEGLRQAFLGAGLTK